METDKYKRLVEEILYPAGIIVNGNNPWDIRIKDDRFYKRVIKEGSLGLGESNMDEWWECERLDEFFYKLLPSNPEEKVRKNLKIILHELPAVVFNLGSKSRSFQIGERHYDIGNELYRHMLDRRMIYSCGYWKDASDLDSAQEAKLDLICRKIGLRRGEKVLDIGCGWGGFAKYVSEKYGASVVGITVSKEQVSLAREYCRGLPIEIRLQDYRDVNEKFDHIVSIGMFEHVGHKNYRTYMEAVYQCLKDEGIFLLHTIGDSRSNVANDPWLGKYIFPNSMIPSMKQISASFEGLFVIEDWHNFGYYYDPTLMSWFHNFDRNWLKFRPAYGDRFYRMWKYYLLSCAGAFRSRHMHVWQIVLSKKGIPGGYYAIR
ncbi:MAG: cyclopropane fatty acyl phospholipid synthase [Nitrospirota bacterium]|nr:cyclopropane fatty acyl phospholipid synthase [Nitrospirota bacterium]